MWMVGRPKAELVVSADDRATLTRWTARSKTAGLSRATVGRIWRAFGLQLHRTTETFKSSTDPQLIEKVRDIVGLYLNPPDALVLCADEKSHASGRVIGELHRRHPSTEFCKFLNRD